jgi:hypothetical protein
MSLMPGYAFPRVRFMQSFLLRKPVIDLGVSSWQLSRGGFKKTSYRRVLIKYRKMPKHSLHTQTGNVDYKKNEDFCIAFF